MGLLKATPAVGLEFDTGVIRVVQLKGTPRSASIEVIGRVEIPEDAVIEGVVVDAERVASALEELWNTYQIKSREVVLGISNQGVFMRTATFPKIPEKKLAQALRFQAADYFPIPMPQLVFDYSVVGEYIGANGPELELLLVAARREMLDSTLNILLKAKLQPKIVDTSYLALMRVIPEIQLAGTVLLAEISNGMATLLLVSNGIPRFARAIPYSLQSYAREMNLPLEGILTTMPEVAATAEEAVERGIPKNFPVGWGSILAGDIRSSVSYYLTQRSDSAVETIFLSGRGARIPGLKEFLQQELEVPVKLVEPLSGLGDSLKSDKIDIKTEGPDFAVSIGLALRGLED